jgi:hypothetical protein
MMATKYTKCPKIDRIALKCTSNVFARPSKIYPNLKINHLATLANFMNATKTGFKEV